MSDVDVLRAYVLRHGDRALVLAQRLLEAITHAPEIEHDMALANLALDLLGQARTLYSYVGDEDQLAYFRDAGEFLNPLLVEQPNGDFAHLIARQLLHDAFALPYWEAMRASADATLAALAAKACKETAYHLRHSRSWVVRLGDGTPESHARVQSAIDELWPFTAELFEADDVDRSLTTSGIAADPRALQVAWRRTVETTLAEATLDVPPNTAGIDQRGRNGDHSDGFPALIGELQELARAHPGASW